MIIGSIMRDAEEKNLNRVGFAEFQANSWKREPTKRGVLYEALQSELVKSDDLRSAKQSLMAIAEFERKLMEISFQPLEKVLCSPEAIEALKVFIDVTDLFGQLCVAKDLTSRKRNAEHMGG